jgi:HEAT repeat protein
MTIQEILKKVDPKKPMSLVECKVELVEIGKGRVDELRSVLKNGGVFERWVVASAFGELLETESVPSLIDALSDENASVRVVAAQSLAAMGDASGVDVLRKALEDDSVFLGHPPVLVKYYAKKVIQRYSKLLGIEPSSMEE